jgi:hypothetical protein|tara:strand:+ start:296 stop:583 length:288 start_codon:yes stop_codon:yes gene_type:complete
VTYNIVCQTKEKVKEIKVTNILEMSEAHLMNVQREIQSLENQKIELDSELEKLTTYLKEGVDAVEQARSEAQAALAGSAVTPSTVETNFVETMNQ